MASRYLVDTLSGGLAGIASAAHAWSAFLLLASLIAADNLLWRLASWIASSAFVGVSGDLRRDLFRHLTGHAPSFFADRMSGTLTSRITATSNAVYTLENMFVWNVLPPCMATIVAIAFVATVSMAMAAALIILAAILVFMMFRLAAAGRPLHHDFADRAAAVDGEMSDVVGNMPLVWAFCGLAREHSRLDATIDREMAARHRSLVYLERLRLFHAAVTVVLTIALLAWAIVLWQKGVGTAGDVVLVCTLGLSILHILAEIWQSHSWTLRNTSPGSRRRSRRFSFRIDCAISRGQNRWRDQAPALPSRASPSLTPTAESFHRLQPAHCACPARGPCRTIRLREIDFLRAAATPLRCAAWVCPDRRPGYFASDAGELAGRHCCRSAGHFTVSPLHHGKHSIWATAGIRCGSI